MNAKGAISMVYSAIVNTPPPEGRLYGPNFANIGNTNLFTPKNAALRQPEIIARLYEESSTILGL
jgi:hypothetical protein